MATWHLTCPSCNAPSPEMRVDADPGPPDEELGEGEFFCDACGMRTPVARWTWTRARDDAGGA